MRMARADRRAGVRGPALRRAGEQSWLQAMHDPSQRARARREVAPPSRSRREVCAIFSLHMASDLESINREQAASLKLWVVLNRAQEAVAAVARMDVERGELSLTEFGVMEVLFHKGDLTAGEVSRRVLLRSGSLTYVIDKLVERALIKRHVCETDKRRTYLQLTASGNALMRKIWPGHAAAIEGATSALTLAEKRTAARLLKKMGLHAELVEKPGTKRG